MSSPQSPSGFPSATEWPNNVPGLDSDAFVHHHGSATRLRANRDGGFLIVSTVARMAVGEYIAITRYLANGLQKEQFNVKGSVTDAAYENGKLYVMGNLLSHPNYVRVVIEGTQGATADTFCQHEDFSDAMGPPGALAVSTRGLACVLKKTYARWELNLYNATTGDLLGRVLRTGLMPVVQDGPTRHPVGSDFWRPVDVGFDGRERLFIAHARGQLTVMRGLGDAAAGTLSTTQVREERAENYTESVFPEMSVHPNGSVALCGGGQGLVLDDKGVALLRFSYNCSVARAALLCDGRIVLADGTRGIKLGAVMASCVPVFAWNEQRHAAFPPAFRAAVRTILHMSGSKLGAQSWGTFPVELLILVVDELARVWARTAVLAA